MASPLSSPRAGQHLQAFQAMSLKCVRRTARLEGAAAEDAGAGAAHMVGRGHQLELGFNRAGASHGDELVAADLQIEHRDHRLLAPVALQNIGCFGKSFLPIFAHRVRSVLGKLQATRKKGDPPQSKGGETKARDQGSGASLRSVRSSRFFERARLYSCRKSSRCFERARLYRPRKNSLYTCVLKGTGFSPYINPCKMNAGFSP